MKKFTPIVWLYSFALFCTLGMFNCQKPDEPEPGSDPQLNPNPTEVAIDADTLSNHLLFFNALKKQGAIPKGPANNTLRISFKDTLHLADELKKPVRFRHDSTENVAGIFLQVRNFSAGAATFYYQVPEVEEMAENDTVSVIMIGIEPTGLVFPQTFEITITPYDETGKLLAETTKPVKVEQPNNDPNSNGGCGLVLQDGEYWDWIMSIVLGTNGNDYDFYNQPGKIFSGQGQNIEGSCCYGHSTYPEYCPGSGYPGRHNAQLHFATYYKINFETFHFYNNKTFLRQTAEDSPLPLPAESDFCAGGEGKVKPSLKHTLYDGEWEIVPYTYQPNPYALYLKNDKYNLLLRTTSSSGAGYGNPGGVIHQIDCKIGSLVLVQLDLEGGRRNLIKVYELRKAGEPIWYYMNG